MDALRKEGTRWATGDEIKAAQQHLHFQQYIQ